MAALLLANLAISSDSLWTARVAAIWGALLLLHLSVLSLAAARTDSSEAAARAGVSEIGSNQPAAVPAPAGPPAQPLATGSTPAVEDRLLAVAHVANAAVSDDVAAIWRAATLPADRRDFSVTWGIARPVEPLAQAVTRESTPEEAATPGWPGALDLVADPFSYPGAPA
ncbi:MAG: hypothetical protein IT337_10735 [Thermomicrobiales bacterium]|nr:hypothetical protein [Thermomicrobiales bacterium]